MKETGLLVLLLTQGGCFRKKRETMEEMTKQPAFGLNMEILMSRIQRLELEGRLVILLNEFGLKCAMKLYPDE